MRVYVQCTVNVSQSCSKHGPGTLRYNAVANYAPRVVICGHFSRFFPRTASREMSSRCSFSIASLLADCASYLCYARNIQAIGNIHAIFTQYSHNIHTIFTQYPYYHRAYNNIDTPFLLAQYTLVFACIRSS